MRCFPLKGKIRQRGRSCQVLCVIKLNQENEFDAETIRHRSTEVAVSKKAPDVMDIGAFPVFRDAALVRFAVVALDRFREHGGSVDDDRKGRVFKKRDRRR